MKDIRNYKTTGKFFAALFFICLAAVAFGGCGRDKETVELEVFREGCEKADAQGLAGEEKIPAEDGGAASDPPREEEKTVVYVCGAVNSPGVYTLAADSRVYEAIEAAGGIRSDGCGEILNQARPVKDGERIYVPTKEEVSVSDFIGNGFGEPAKVNINTASREELMALPGIGALKADGIISYREQNGGFKSIEELTNVGGIKEGIFGKLKDKITV